MEHLIFLADGETFTGVGELERPASIITVEKAHGNDIKLRAYSLPLLLASLNQRQWDMAEIDVTEKQSNILLP